MATFKAEVQNKRADGTYNVRIRVTHNRQVRRMSTNIYAKQGDLTKGLKIKNPDIINASNKLISQCITICNELSFHIDGGWKLRNIIIWHKPNQLPQGVIDRL